MSYYPGSPFGELYNLTEDPHEFDNLWADPKCGAVRRRLTGELLDRALAAHDPLPVREEPF